MAKKKIVIQTKYEVEGADKVQQSYKDVGESAESAATSTGKVNKNAHAFTDAMPGKLGAVQAGFVALKGGLMKAVTGFKTLRGAMISTGIGAIVVAFGVLAQYFTDNEEGASKLKKITAGLGVVMGNITDIISDLGEKLFSAFENPKEAITGLWELIKTNIVNRFTGLADMFGALGKVIKSAFTLDFEGLKEASADLGESTLQAMTGVDDLTGKIAKGMEMVKEFAKDTQREVNQAMKLEKDRLALARFERMAIVDKAQAERDMMELRLKARDEERFATEERLEFMREANKIAAEQLEKDLHVAKEKLRHQTEENTYSKSTAENLDAEAKLKAEVFRIEKANFSERKRMKSEEQALVKQAEANALKIKKAKEAEAKKEAKILMQRRKLDIELQEDGLKKEIELIAFNAEQKRNKLEEEGVLTAELEIKLAEETARKIQEARMKANEALMSEEKKKNIEETALKKTHDDKLISAKAQFNSSMVGFADSLTSVLGENSKVALGIQKAVALRTIAIDTAQAISGLTKASAQNKLNGVTGGAAGAFQFATGLLQIGTNMAKAYSILKAPAPKIDGGESGGSNAPTTQQTSPNLGFEGRSSGSEQFGAQVVRAYVTESDITTSQNTASNIQQLSEIG